MEGYVVVMKEGFYVYEMPGPNILIINSLLCWSALGRSYFYPYCINISNKRYENLLC